MKFVRNLAVTAHRQRPSKLGAVMVVAVLLLGMLLVASSFYAGTTLRERRNAAEWTRETRDMLDATARLKLATLSSLSGQRSYLLTQDEDLLAAYYRSRTQLRADIDWIAGEYANHPSRARQIARLNEQIGAHLQKLDELIRLDRDGERSDAIRGIVSGEGEESASAVLDEIAAFETVERALLAQRSERLETLRTRSEQMQVVLGLAGLLLLSLGTLSAIFLRRSLIREAAAKEELRRIAMTDELTGLANRREVLSSLDRMIASARRSGRPLSLAILDIDRFKRVNDTYGHPAGDEVIKAVGTVATRVMREQDLVGRLGGEEFVIAFPDCTAESAMEACERLRSAIADLPILVEGGVVLKITLSLGVAQYREDCDRTSLIARADEALYEAKEGGRDQVRLAA